VTGCGEGPQQVDGLVAGEARSEGRFAQQRFDDEFGAASPLVLVGAPQLRQLGVGCGGCLQNRFDVGVAIADAHEVAGVQPQ
jgi:hypothetical protein